MRDYSADFQWCFQALLSAFERPPRWSCHDLGFVVSGWVSVMRLFAVASGTFLWIRLCSRVPAGLSALSIPLSVIRLPTAGEQRYHRSNCWWTLTALNLYLDFYQQLTPWIDQENVKEVSKEFLTDINPIVRNNAGLRHVIIGFTLRSVGYSQDPKAMKSKWTSSEQENDGNSETGKTS